MLKKLIITMLFTGVAVTSYGQGQVNFVTRSINSAPGPFVTLAQAFNGQAAGSRVGTNTTGGLYYAQLWAADGVGQAETSLTPVGNLVNFRSGALNSGYVQETGTPVGSGSNVAVSSVVNVTAVNGGAVTLQVRAWSSAFATYAAAAAAPGTAAFGKSSLFSLALTGNPNGGPLSTLPVDLTGFQGFALAVPEPSTIALGALGLGSLFFVRRRK